jgi:Ion channel
MISAVVNLIRLLKAIKRSWDTPLFRSAFLLAGMILLSGTIFYHSVEGWSWIDSFYFSVTTASTVGQGDLAPKTDAGKLFTTLYIFVGVGVFFVLFALLAKALLKAEDKNE